MWTASCPQRRGGPPAGSSMLQHFMGRPAPSLRPPIHKWCVARACTRQRVLLALQRLPSCGGGGGAGHVVEPLQPVLATWLVVEVTLFALIVRAEGRGKPETARGSWLGRALWLWQHRADVLAVGQDAAVLLFLVVMTGVAHQAGLVALAATL